MSKTILHSYLILFLFIGFTGLAQSGEEGKGRLEQFQRITQAEERFTFFFDNSSRYEQDSEYDWLKTINASLADAEQAQDSLAIQVYTLMQSQLYSDIGDFEKSIGVGKELYESKDELPGSTQKLLLDILDNGYGNLQLFDKQIEIRKQKQELGFSQNVNFYDIYSGLGQYRKAMEQYIMEVSPTIPDNDFFSLAKHHNQIGNYLRLDNASQTAISEFKKANGYLEVFLNDDNQDKTEEQTNESTPLKALIMGNIGKSYVQLKEYDLALPELEKSLETLTQLKGLNYQKEINDNLLYLADTYLNLRRYRNARRILTSRIINPNIDQTKRRNFLLASYYEKDANFEAASSLLKRNHYIDDSLKTQSSGLMRQQLLTLVANEDLANTQRIIDEQKRINQLNFAEMKAQDERTNLVFISLIFTLLGFVGLVYAYLKSIKNQRLIAEQKYIIEKALVEKDSLLKEIHHRVKNNLQMVSSLLSLQTKNTRNKSAIAALEEGKSRVKAMALIHQKLYQNDDLSVIEMQGYIESLINSVQSVYKKGGHNIDITVDAKGTELDIDRAIPFGLILNELVSNSFKYAFPENDDNGKIYIHLRKDDKEGYFEYTDNGIGLPEDTDERTHSSMGIRLMNRLVNQLQSKLNIDRKADGVRFWFNFK